MHNLSTSGKLISVRYLTTASSAAAWITTNSTFKKHPRLRSIEQCTTLRQLKTFLAFTIVSRLFNNPFVASRILLSSATTANSEFSALIFAQMERPNLFSWNTLIGAQPNSALHLYVEMLHGGTLPNKFTPPILLKSCFSSHHLGAGRRIHTHAFILGFADDPFVHTALVDMYLRCGSVGDALFLFDEMPHIHRDVVSWTAVISGLVHHGCHFKALEVFNGMRRGYAGPNEATLLSVMSACAGSGSLDHTKSLHANMVKVGLINCSIFVKNSLIDAYAKCGSIPSAAQVFDTMCVRDLHSWTAMITGLATYGMGKEALDVFSKLEKEGLKPDSVTFVAVLAACSHAGLIEEGIMIFDSMKKLYAIDPVVKHYGCMVDLFSRAGLLARAYEFIMNMPVEPNLTILGALLSACRVHNNLELGQLVSKKIESSCRYQGGAPVLLSNMFASQMQWREVVSIREVTGGYEGKSPGKSWIEVKGGVHDFFVEDRSHPIARELHLVLDGLGKLMEGIQDSPSFPSF